MTGSKTHLSAANYRPLIREAIRNRFLDLVRSVKSGNGSLAEVADQLGVRRQALDQYAKGSVPQSDVLLMALLVWDWVLKVEDPKGDQPWSEFSLSALEGGTRRRKPQPVQLSLFDALTDLDQNMEALKKSAGRVEFEVKRALEKLA